MNAIKLLQRRSKTITSAAFILSLSAFLSGVLGLVRNKILAHQFGASDVVDVYTAAFRIPDLVFALLVTGLLSAGFIPVFTSVLEGKSRRQAWQMMSNVLSILSVLLVVASLGLFLLAPFILPFIVPGFSAAKLADTLILTRILFLSPIILGISHLVSGALKSLRHFAIVALAPIVYSLGIIVGIVWFYRWWGLVGLALGVISGALAHLAIQLPTLGLAGFRFRRVLQLRDRGFMRIVRLAPMRTLAMGFNQLNIFIITGIASTLGSGAVAVLFNFAKPLQDFPVTIFGLSFAVAAFPTLSSLASRGKWERFSARFASTFRQVALFLLPASALLFVLRAQVVRILYGSGAFDWPATIKTLDTVGLFALSLIAQGLVFLLLRSFYAIQNTVTPMLGSLVLVIVSTVSSLLLAPLLGVKGLALALSLASFAQLLFLWVTLRRRVPTLKKQDVPLAKSLVKIIVASLVAALISRGTLYLIAPALDTYTGLGLLTQGVIAGLAGLFSYLLIIWLLRLEDIKALDRFLRSMRAK